MLALCESIRGGYQALRVTWYLTPWCHILLWAVEGLHEQGLCGLQWCVREVKMRMDGVHLSIRGLRGVTDGVTVNRKCLTHTEKHSDPDVKNTNHLKEAETGSTCSPPSPRPPPSGLELFLRLWGQLTVALTHRHQVAAETSLIIIFITGSATVLNVSFKSNTQHKNIVMFTYFTNLTFGCVSLQEVIPGPYTGNTGSPNPSSFILFHLEQELFKCLYLVPK